MQATEMVAMIVVVITLFSCFGWVSWTGINNWRRIKVSRSQVEMQSKLLDKFGGSAELLDYLQTDAGKQFLQTEPAERPSAPHWRILRTMQAGIILTLLGLAILTGATIVREASQELSLAGILVTAVGLGFLISSFLSYKFSKSWGILDSRPKGE